ncbi:MAG: hypothetical protein J0H68_05900 [Sphingobacteriia bacterium]|nr:hypothetical protein [Sphingobacteriia bacterium]
MKLTQQLISIEDKDAWSKVLHNNIHTFYHSYEYNKAISNSFDNIFLYHGYNQNFSAICPLQIRQKKLINDVTTPYGFSGLMINGIYNNFSNEWAEFMSLNNIIAGYILLNPIQNNQAMFENKDIFYGQSLYFINLEDDLKTIFANFSSTHRSLINQWERKNYSFVFDKNKLFEKFLSLYNQTLDRVQASTVYRFSEQTLKEIFFHPQCLSIGVENNNILEAVSVFTYTSKYSDYFLNASTMEGRVHTRALIWEAIKQLKALKIPVLGLGGGIKENDSLAEFKSRFSGWSKKNIVLKQIYNNEKYQNICKELEIDCTDKSGYFPAYWNPNINKQKEKVI